MPGIGDCSALGMAAGVSEGMAALLWKSISPVRMWSRHGCLLGYGHIRGGYGLDVGMAVLSLGVAKAVGVALGVPLVWV